MNSKILTAIVVTGTGAALLGWYDLFHLTVGLPLLMAEAFLLRWWKQRKQLEKEEEDEGLAPQMSVGTLEGGVSLLLLAGGFWGASIIGIPDWFPGRDCADLLKQISVLEDGDAHVRITQLIDERLQRPISLACKEELTEHKVRAFLDLAKKVTREEKIKKIEEATHLAAEVNNPTLQQLVDAELQVAGAEVKIAQQQETIKQQGVQIARQQETIEQQGVQITQQQETIKQQGVKIARQQETIKQQSADLARTRALLRELQQGGLKVR